MVDLMGAIFVNVIAQNIDNSLWYCNERLHIHHTNQPLELELEPPYITSTLIN